jgi:predicted Zn-dependent protease
VPTAVERLALPLLVCTTAACASIPPGVPAPPVERLVSPPTPVVEVDAVGLKHLLRGLYFLHQGQTAAAIPHLRLALVYAPTSALLHERLSQAWHATGNLARAAEALARGLEHAPGDPWLSTMAGELALRERRYADAVTHLRLATGTDETLAWSGPALVDALLWRGELEAAGLELVRLEARRPGDGTLALRLAQVLEDHGQLELALRTYRAARVQGPSDRQAALGEMRVHFLTGQDLLAADSLVPLFAFYPDDVDLYILVARLAGRAGRDDADTYRAEALRLAEADTRAIVDVAAGDLLEGRLPAGLGLLRELVAAEPTAVTARVFLGETLLRLGDARGCLQVLTGATLSPPPALYRVRAWCHAYSGEPDLALEQVTFAALESAQPRDALLEAARFLSQTVSEEEAARSVQDLCVRTRGQQGPADCALARALVADLFGRADEALRLVTELPPAAVRDVEVELRRADLLVRAGQVEAGVAELERLLLEQPDDAVRLNALGFTLADAGLRLAEAEVYLRRAYRLSPDDGYVTDSLGWALYRRGDLATALRLLVAASRAVPGDPEILRHLGDVYAALGRADAARAAYRAALDAHPPASMRPLIEARLRDGGPP